MINIRLSSDTKYELDIIKADILRELKKSVSFDDIVSKMLAMIPHTTIIKNFTELLISIEE